MNHEYPSLQELKKEFGMNKFIPSKYEHPILKALSHYSELKETYIEFRLKKKNPAPHNTTLAVNSFLKLRIKYVINLLDEAKPPIRQALFRNLPEIAQVGVIGHELGNVTQYLAMNAAAAFKRALTTSKGAARRTLERGADVIAIEHGLGFELYTHAIFIRSIEGYMEQRKEIDICYLHPHEILEALPPQQLQDINTSA